MTSLERREVRYQRRKAKRENKKRDFIESLGGYDNIFTFDNLYYAFYECRKGVRWKSSIQSYELSLLSNTYSIYRELREGIWKSKGFMKFYISERGKVRKIQSVHISERCIQRVLCDKYLVPLISKYLIYDNGASLKGKGIDFSIRRVKKHLEDYYRKNKSNNGYILLYDFSNYFGNISHEKLFELVDKLIPDDKIKRLYHDLINAFDEGIGLGSQVSQISAIYFANKIDHTFKDKLAVKGYARYMDDGYIISDNLNSIRMYKQVLYDLCNELGIKINEKKIKICKLSNGFTFLKKKFLLKSNGKVVIRLIKKTFKAVKRRLKRMNEKNVPYEDISTSYRSWRGNACKYDNFKNSVKSIDAYYNKLFIEPFIRGEAC